MSAIRRLLLHTALAATVIVAPAQGPRPTRFSWIGKQPVGCAADQFRALSLCKPHPQLIRAVPGASYTDPNFGGQVTVVAPGAHQYSGISPISSGGKYLHVINEVHGGSSILDAHSGAVINTGGDVPYPVCHWSNDSDDVCYYTSPDSPRIMAYSVSKNSSHAVIDYGKRFTGKLSDGGTTDISKDEWLAFWAPEQHTVCAADLRNKTTACADYQAPNPRVLRPTGDIDYVAISRGPDAVSGKRYVMLFADSLGIYSVDAANERLTLEAKPDFGLGSMGATPKNNGDGVCQPGENCPTTPHGDVFESADGQQFFLFETGYEGVLEGSQHCELALSTVRLNAGGKSFTDATHGGGMTRVLTVSPCGATWQSSHIGCARLKPVCVVSTDAGANAPQDGKTPYYNELFLATFGRRMSATITPVAMHRSSEAQYWDQPRAALDFSGETVIFDSDFGDAKLFVNYVRTVPSTPAGTPPPLEQK